MPPASPDPPADPPETYALARQVFLRGLGGVYLVAFLSLWTQVHGLIGHRGLLPIDEFLPRVRAELPGEWWWRFPTLCWINPSDRSLDWLCAGGVACALLVVAGLAQAPSLAALWALYLSLVVAGQDFLSFQWDSLLLEVGFLAIFFAPLQLGPRLARQPPPSRVVLWLLWWVLFRLMFLSGLVKLTFGDPTWHTGRAMYYHYLSQPLPTWTSWYAYNLPQGFQRLSVWAMFLIEMSVPLLICVPRWPRLGPAGGRARFGRLPLARRPRTLAFWPLVLLQALIAATGNYGFFNLLTVVLCLTLLDDATLRRWFGWVSERWRRLRRADAKPAESRPVADPPRPMLPNGLRWPLAVTVPLAVVLLILTTLEAVAGSSPRMQLRAYQWPAPVATARQWAAPFRSANAYGLFRVMTRTRPEVVVEGSRDGVTWEAYEFRWKPGDPARRPAFATPHMPRLDWQIWTPFLSGFGNDAWLVNLLDRLLHGTPEVLALLGRNPFADAPPRFVRVVAYDYHFTNADERARTGAWWRRDLLGLYARPIMLDRETDQPTYAFPAELLP